MVSAHCSIWSSSGGLTTKVVWNSHQFAGAGSIPVRRDGDVFAKTGRVQVLHEPQGHAPRGEARRVDPAAC